MLDLSVASLFGYRNGKIHISPKGWSKLERAERAAGVGIAESSANPKHPDVGESDNVMHEDSPPYGAKAKPRPELSIEERLERAENLLAMMAGQFESLAAAIKRVL